jgi:hypothetical protein
MRLEPTSRRLGRVPSSLEAFAVLIATFLAITGSTNGQELHDDTAVDRTLLQLAGEHFKNVPAYQKDTFTLFFQTLETTGKIDLAKDGDDKDPKNAAKWNNSREIDAKWIEWACSDPRAVAKVAASGIELDNVRVVGDLDLRQLKIPFWIIADRSAFDGKITLHGATIRGLRLRKSRAAGLVANGLKVEKSFELSDGFVSTETVFLQDLDVTGSVLMNSVFNRGLPNREMEPWPEAVNLRSAKIGGDLSFQDCTVTGAVVIDSAQIDGDLNCKGGHFHGEANDGKNGAERIDNAIFASGVKIRRNLNLTEADVVGTIILTGAVIGGDIDCTSANLCRNGGTALRLDTARIDGSVMLSGNFSTEGELSFAKAVVGHRIQLEPDQPFDDNVKLDLRDASAGSLSNSRNGFPAKDNLKIHGFVFGALDHMGSADSPPAATDENDWLSRQKSDDFSSQSYEQMATVLRHMGLEDDAIAVLIAKNDRESFEKIKEDFQKADEESPNFFWSSGKLWSSEIKTLSDAGKWVLDLMWYYLFGPLIAYGYRPWRAILPSGGFILLGWLIFRVCFKEGLFKSADKNTLDAATDVTGRTQAFNAFIYSLEKFVPLLDLGMGDLWAPNPSVPGGRWLSYWLYFHMIAGWILTTLWVAALTGLLKT